MPSFRAEAAAPGQTAAPRNPVLALLEARGASPSMSDELAPDAVKNARDVAQGAAAFRRASARVSRR